MTAKQIENETKIPFHLLSVVLRTLIKPLVTGKVKGPNVLKSESKSDEVVESDLFSVNEEFSTLRKRVKIPINLPKRREIKKARMEEKEKINQDQRYEIDAAVVQTLKRKKSVEHAMLVSEVLEQLSHRFKPEV